MKSEVYKTIDDFLVLLSKKHSGSIHDMGADPYSAVASNAIEILKKYELVRFRSYDTMASIVDFGVNGQDCIDAGGIENYITLKESKSPVSAVHIGHNINSPIDQSRLEANINLPTNAYNTTNAPTKSKTSVLEKLYWIAGIIIALIALYEFYLKYHLIWR